jgi:hypothetical protein
MKIFSDVSARPLMKSIKILSSLIDDEGGLYTQPKTNDTVLLCTPRNSTAEVHGDWLYLKVGQNSVRKVHTNTTTPPAELIPPE